MKRYFKLAAIYFKYSMKSAFVYKGAFLLGALGQFLGYAVDFGLMWVMISAFGTMAGWTQYEVMLLYAMSLISYALGAFSFYNVAITIQQGAYNGSLDDALVKPVSLLPYLVFSNFNWGYVSHLSLGLIVMIVCFSQLAVSWNIFKILYFMITIFSGAILYAALFLFTSVPAFFTIKSNQLSRILFFFRKMSYYPLTIFPKALQFLLTFLIPYGMMNFYPLHYILEKNDDILFGSWLTFAAPVFCLLLFISSIYFFRYGIKHYASSGS